jgi:hypothetical protein
MDGSLLTELLLPMLRCDNGLSCWCLLEFVNGMCLFWCLFLCLLPALSFPPSCVCVFYTCMYVCMFLCLLPAGDSWHSSKIIHPRYRG